MAFSSRDLAAFYYQLGTMLQAGVSIQGALTSLGQTAPRLMRPAVTTLREWTGRGQTFHEGLAQQPRAFPALDRHTIALTEQSGALDVGLLSLSQFHEHRAKARSSLIAASVLPGIMFVAAVFISRAPAFVLGFFGEGNYGIGCYLRDTVGFLVVVTAAAFALNRWIGHLLTVPGTNVRVDRWLNAVPIFGRVRFDYALSQWVSSLRLMLKAGFGVVPALECCSPAGHSPVIAAAWARARPLVHSQMDVSAALRQTGAFPDMVIQFWATGEQSGKMDEMLDRLAQHYEDRWRRNLELLVVWLPRIAYAAVCGYLVWQILTMLGPVVGVYREMLK